MQGVHPSASQFSHATACSRVAYTCAPAEALPPHPVDYNLITAAQAAHWFRLDDFYHEVRRVAAPGAVIALISYGVLQLEGEPNERFQRFYFDEIGPPLYIRQEWTFDSLAGYISTWSVVAKAGEAGQDDH
ncbi:MAG: class I SAM-dependent methyltransferase [Pantoea sp.]|uniref:class I SAM-dependent methyltransferase n=1 Tax=Pantoea sp. TaxID=69393 RepID=UPI002398899A|nr:class I SAM-dependent methyltransferase [Pantoea sp.]MDE1189017.1 class I SAM-dependent methyltransferase [Pantoea sp.]